MSPQILHLAERHLSVEPCKPWQPPMGRQVLLGHHFVFVSDPKALGRRGRKGRLLLGREPGTPRVLPVLDQPLEEIESLVIRRTEPAAEPLACLVSDRDLYRAEQDTVYLFAAMPQPIDDLHLVVEMNGAPFSERRLDLGSEGVALESLELLLPGQYEARLRLGDRPLGARAGFTVAEYSLAPLAARLVSHALDRKRDQLEFELAVESYELPFDRPVDVTLVDAGLELGRTRLEATSPGKYAGRLRLEGEGPHRLRVMAADDASRVAEVALPGSRAAERQLSVLSELGQEALFSLMPEPEALPVRGGFMTRGDTNATPLVVEEVIADQGRMKVQTDVESLVVLELDLASGRLSARELGDLGAGQEVTIDTPAPGVMVFAGCFVRGEPFEGYTTFLRPQRLELSLEAAEEARPGEELEVRIAAGGGRRVPVLVSLRDARLTATETPDKGLAASLKRAVDSASEGMDDPDPFVPIAEVCGPETTFYSQAVLMSVAPAGLDCLMDTGGTMDALVMEEAAFGGAKDLELEEMPAEEAGAEPRDTFPEVLFCDVVGVEGEETLSIPLGDAPGSYRLEAFALAEGDWARCEASVKVDKPVRVDLELPPCIHPEDQVSARLRLATSSGQARVRLLRDGEPVPLSLPDGSSVSEALRHEGPLELSFAAAPGSYSACLEDQGSGESDAIEVHVAEPGRFRSLVRRLIMLQPGESLTLDSADALTLRVLPGLDEPFGTLVDATADYTHLCCEQTAAKIIAAVVMVLTADKPAVRRRAEDIILRGLAREEKMWIRGRGFSMYPESRGVNDYYGPMTVRYLWSLSRLEGLPELSSRLRRAVRDGLVMADDAGRGYGLERVPLRIASGQDAYAVASEGPASRRSEVESYLTRHIDLEAAEPRLRSSQHAVVDRALFAWAAACLLVLRQHAKALKLANLVTGQLTAEGMLYSTVDSVAAMALLGELQRAGLFGGAGRVRANGQERTSAEVVALGDQVETVEALEGVTLVEVTRIVEEDWSALDVSMPVKVGLHEPGGRTAGALRQGERVELAVSLPRGYQDGDLVHVSLPSCLSWIHGGGKVKLFSLDFEGRDSLSIPLVVTEGFRGTQHYAVCVRNMFEEERASALADLTVSAA